MKRLVSRWIAVLALNCIAFVSIASAQLGSAATDLVFTPVPSCRIFDTRIAGGALVANTARNFDVTAVSDYSSQGGESSNCGGLGAAGSFAALAVNFTIINPNVSGTLKAYPLGASAPVVASSMSFAAGEVRSNFAIVKLDQGASANELTLLSTAGAHVTADVVGFFAVPVATALECIDTESAAVNINAGSFATRSTPACGAGYTITGGGCSTSNFDGRVVTSRTIVTSTSQTHFCAFRNEGSAAIDGIAYGRCCRVPGRLP